MKNPTVHNLFDQLVKEQNTLREFLETGIPYKEATRLTYGDETIEEVERMLNEVKEVFALAENVGCSAIVPGQNKQ